MASGPSHQQDTTYELESRLLETVQRYELIFKATSDVLYELDLRTGTVEWNDTLYTQYGFKKTAKTHRFEWWAQQIHPDDALRVEFELMSWLEGKNDTWQSEYRFKKADGEYAYVRDRGVVMRDKEGKPLRVIGSFLDITKQIQLDRAKDEFISLVSHQLRTPLTAIRMYSEMLIDGTFGPLSKEQEAKIRHIADSSIKLIAMVGEILDVSRIEMDKIKSSPSLVHLDRFIQESVEAIHSQALSKKISLRFIPAHKTGKVNIDTALLGQMLHNLLSNAIRYTNSENGQIEVGVEQTDRGFVISVKDNGIGIPKSSQPHVFNRFYRAENTMNINEEGAGLGLYLVQQIAQATGCKVWFKSAKNRGSTFYLLIPSQGMKRT